MKWLILIVDVTMWLTNIMYILIGIFVCMIELIGVAYLLRILGLNNEFDSLKWFQSVSENYEDKLNVLKTQEIKALKDDAKLQQPLSLSYTRLQVYYKVK